MTRTLKLSIAIFVILIISYVLDYHFEIETVLIYPFALMAAVPYVLALMTPRSISCEKVATGMLDCSDDMLFVYYLLFSALIAMLPLIYEKLKRK